MDTSRLLPVAIFTSALLVIIFRDFTLITQPRFWAEDGMHFFSYAFSHNWLDTLLYHPEYELVLSNLSALAAKFLVPLEWAPLPFAIAWLITITCALAIIAWGKSPLWDTPARKLVASAIILFAPRSAEIWMNANGVQYYAVLVTALILTEPSPDHGFRKLAYRIMLATASLNGVLSCLLIPLFWLKYLLVKEHKEVAIQAIILGAGALIQLITIFTSNEHASRDILMRTDVIGWIAAVRTFALPFSSELANIIYAPVSQEGYLVSESFTRYGNILFAAWISVILLLAFRLRRSAGLYLLLSYVLVFLFVSIFGIGGPDNTALIKPYLGHRYYYVTTALFLLALMASAQTNAETSRLPRAAQAWPTVTGLLLLLAITNGIVQFYTEDVHLTSWKNWEDEVVVWREEPRYWLHIWPEPWSIPLSKPGN